MSAEIPDSIIAITTEEGTKFNTEEVEAMQRQLQEVMAGDYTKLPVITMSEDAKIEWIDFKGMGKESDPALYERITEYLRQDKSNIDFYKERAQILQQQMEKGDIMNEEYIRRGGTIPLTTDAE